jgi:PPM family protein phosphatase
MSMVYELGQANRLGNRSSNQDRLAAIESPQGVLLALADGMGGHQQGEIAAELFISTARAAYSALNAPVADPALLLRSIILLSHREILKIASDNDSHRLPGTTAILCLVENGVAHWAHVGDSRLYLLQRDRPLWHTIDHSRVEELYRQGLISAEERRSHPERNRLTQCLGCRPQPPAITLGMPRRLNRDDLLLLCSDGLWSALPAATLQQFYAINDNLDRAIDHLAALAEEASYPHSDNISALAFRFCSTTRPTKELPVNDAIARIEAVMREYAGELNSPSHTE